jgi:serine/threonine protein kinase
VTDGRAKQGSRPRADVLPKPWTGSNKYNRVCEIGRGAFATVHKVTMKLTGQPYAAKELDKRKFMKNGVLDQKVENEMRIMQRIKHVRRPLPSCYYMLGLCSHSSSQILWNTSSISTGMIGSSSSSWNSSVGATWAG